MRTLMLAIMTLAACGQTNPNQENYDAIREQYRKDHGLDEHGEHGEHGGDGDHADVNGAESADDNGDHAKAGEADEAKEEVAAIAEDAHADVADAAAEGGHAGDPTAGKKIYETYCVACHGPDGKGMGGVAANLVEDKTRLAKSDEQLVTSIREGYQGEIGVMPPWGAQVDEKGAYDVIAYLREEYGDG